GTLSAAKHVPMVAKRPSRPAVPMQYQQHPWRLYTCGLQRKHSRNLQMGRCGHRLSGCGSLRIFLHPAGFEQVRVWTTKGTELNLLDAGEQRSAMECPVRGAQSRYCR